MSRRQTYRTRDPKPASRDPAVDERVRGANHDQLGRVPIVRIPQAKCAACGHTTWRAGGTTVPNISTAEMFRWRACAHCGQSHYFARPMNESEKAKYLEPILASQKLSSTDRTAPVDSTMI